MKLIYHKDHSVTVICPPHKIRIRELDELPQHVWELVHVTTAASMIQNHTAGRPAHEGLAWTAVEDRALVAWLRGDLMCLRGRSAWACACRAARLGLRGWRGLLACYGEADVKKLVTINKNPGDARRVAP